MEQAGVRVKAHAIPAQQRGHGTGMPQVMHARTPVGVGHRREYRQERTQDLPRAVSIQGPAGPDRKERRLARQLWLAGASLGEVLLQQPSDAGTEGDPAVFAELGLPDHEQLSTPVDVGHRQPADLADAESQRIQHDEDGAVRGRASGGAWRIA